jgi:uncharacterized protein (DUF885 family)
LLVLLLVSCDNGGGGGRSESDRFEIFLEQEFVAMAADDTSTLNTLLRYPEAYGIDKASVIGFGGYLPENTLVYERATRATYERLLKFRPEYLSPTQQREYHALASLLSAQIDEEFVLYEDISWFATDTPFLLAEYNFYSTQDLDIYLKLLCDIPRAVDEVGQFFRAQSAAGLFMPDYALDTLLADMDAFIADPSILIDAFAEQVDGMSGLSASQRTQYKQANQQAINKYIVPAYQKLRSVVASLKGTGRNELGTAYLPNGKRYYEQKVRLLTGRNESVDELYQEIEETIASTNVELTALFDQYDIQEADLENVDYGREDYGQILDYLKTRMATDFLAVEGLHHTVKIVPTALQGFAPAFYVIPAIDDISENAIYIDLSQQNYIYNRLPLMAHEGYAGHLYQRAYDFAYSNVSPLRYALDITGYTTGYTEGWAIYIELYSYNWVEYINEAPEIAKYWQLYALMNFAVFARLDIGINYYGWTLAEVEASMASEGYTGIEEMYEFITQKPGYYVKYFSPYRKIETLRKKAQAAMGSRFDPKEFHKAILDGGPRSFNLIEQDVNDYINK